MKPLAVDLFCGLGGWAEGLIAEGWLVVGFDLEDMRAKLGLTPLPHTALVLQDVLTLHGRQFRAAELIVASPPCQFFSYCAMPWTRAKIRAAETRADPQRLNAELALFRACFRLQRQASNAAGRLIPLIVENVRGAQPWVGPARWNYGSFYLWGDVPALMPIVAGNRMKFPAAAAPRMWRERGNPRLDDDEPLAFAFHHAIKGVPHRTTAHWTNPAEHHAIKNNGGSRFNLPHNTASGKGQNPDGRKCQGRDPMASTSGTRRKAASALIAKIPLPLATHIARVFRT